MGVRRRDRWQPEDAVSSPLDARGDPVVDVAPAAPVWAWIRTVHGADRRVLAVALATTPDAVLVEWGRGQAATSAWVWRSAVKHRSNPQHTLRAED